MKKSSGTFEVVKRTCGFTTFPASLFAGEVSLVSLYLVWVFRSLSWSDVLKGTSFQPLNLPFSTVHGIWLYVIPKPDNLLKMFSVLMSWLSSSGFERVLRFCSGMTYCECSGQHTSFALSFAFHLFNTWIFWCVSHLFQILFISLSHLQLNKVLHTACQSSTALSNQIWLLPSLQMCRTLIWPVFQFFSCSELFSKLCMTPISTTTYNLWVWSWEKVGSVSPGSW